MSKKQSQLQSILHFTVIFIAVYLLMQFVVGRFFPDVNNPNSPTAGSVVLRMEDDSIKSGADPKVLIDNNTQEQFVLESKCPMPPLNVYKVVGTENVAIESVDDAYNCNSAAITIEPGDDAELLLSPWKYSLFDEQTTYILEVPDTEITTQFTVAEPNFFTQIFRSFVTKPILNLLVFIASIVPGHNLGWSIIILTILIKLALFFPTQHALEGQKKMQAIQPKIEEIRKKYKDNPQKLNQETMALWKKEKVNPMQSCLPMLLQFPILIGLFFVIRDGSILEYSSHLLYGYNANLPWSFGTNFLGLDLTEPSKYIFPPLLMVLQFAQMKLSFAIAKKKKDQKEDIVDVTPKKKKKKKDDKPDAESMQETQQKVMTYGLPLMIGFFALQFPTAVSLYWAVSTAFAIGQQLVVNRRTMV